MTGRYFQGGARVWPRWLDVGLAAAYLGCPPTTYLRQVNRGV